MHKILPFFVILSILIVTSSACSTAGEFDLHMMPLDEMPMEVQSAPRTVQQAYQFAAANPDVMKQIFCYCGCDSIGHTSNYDCYVSSVGEYGGITFEQHGLACSTCVEITQDVMRMLRDGKSLAESKEYIDETYGKYKLPQDP